MDRDYKQVFSNQVLVYQSTPISTTLPLPSKQFKTALLPLLCKQSNLQLPHPVATMLLFPLQHESYDCATTGYYALSSFPCTRLVDYYVYCTSRASSRSHLTLLPSHLCFIRIGAFLSLYITSICHFLCRLIFKVFTFEGGNSARKLLN